MELKLQIIIGVFIVAGIFYVTHLIRKNRLELKYTLSWLVAAIFVLIVDCFPNLMESLSDLLGIYSSVNTMFFIAFIFSLFIILTLTVAVSIVSNSVKRLNQKIALLEKRIIELERKENMNNVEENRGEEKCH